MKADSKLTQLVMVSPWSLLVFLVIPIFTIVNVKYQIQLPLVGVKPLLGNNAALAVLVGLRFLRYLLGLKKQTRYGSCCGKPREGISIARPAEEVKRTLSGAGFSFEADGSYGEKRDLGYIGTTLLYGGLLVVLVLGLWDNLQQFSGTLLDSMGPATKLSRVESYPILRTGPLTGRPDSLPQMKILNLFFPDKKYPKGAADMALLSEKGEESRKIVTPEDPFAYGAYDIYLARLMFEPKIIITTKDKQPLLIKEIKLKPLVYKLGDYSFYAPFTAGAMSGEVLYQPETKRLKVAMNINGRPVLNTTMIFQRDQQVVQGDYILSCEKMGQWAEIHVLRRRHLPLIAVGGVIALIGLIMRMAIRPQRIWLAEGNGGCRAWVAGKDTTSIIEQVG